MNENSLVYSFFPEHPVTLNIPLPWATESLWSPEQLEKDWCLQDRAEYKEHMVMVITSSFSLSLSICCYLSASVSF